MSSRSRSITTTVSIIVTALVIVLTAVWLEWSVALRLLRSADVSLLAAALGIFTINYALRTLRFKMLLEAPREQFRELLGITTLHGLFNYLLPAKSGELSYIVLSRKHLEVPIPESAATLITARFFDFGVIAFLLPVAVVQFYTDLPSWLLVSSVIYCVVVLAAAVGLVLYLRRTRKAERAVSKRWWGRLVSLASETLQCLRTIDQRRQYAKLWLVTFGIWVCVLSNYYCIARSLGFDVELGQMIVVSIIIIPLSLIPAQGIANLGTHEAGWVAALSIFGYSFDSAFTLAVTSHVVLFAMFVVLGAFGYAILSVRQGGSTESMARKD